LGPLWGDDFACSRAGRKADIAEATRRIMVALEKENWIKESVDAAYGRASTSQKAPRLDLRLRWV
jgi:hypothetical protein